MQGCSYIMKPERSDSEPQQKTCDVLQMLKHRAEQTVHTCFVYFNHTAVCDLLYEPQKAGLKVPQARCLAVGTDVVNAYCSARDSRESYTLAKVAATAELEHATRQPQLSAPANPEARAS